MTASIARTAVLLTLLLLAAAPAAAQRAEPAPDLTEGVGIDPQIGAQIDLDLTFTDELGKKIRLRDYLDGKKPVVLTLGYYRCPMLCDLVLNGFVDALKEIDQEPGENFEIITISIDPNETSTLAKLKKQNYVKSYGRTAANRGWHFLTGTEENIHAVSDTVGFFYRKDEEKNEYIHAAAVFLLTPDGKLSRCLRGVVFETQDVRLSLAEASEGKMVSTLDSLLLLCFHYDSERGTYTMQAQTIMQIGGGLILVVLAFILLPVWLRRRSKKQAAADE
jgi:protein SCO1/2